MKYRVFELHQGKGDDYKPISFHVTRGEAMQALLDHGKGMNVYIHEHKALTKVELQLLIGKPLTTEAAAPYRSTAS